METQQNVNKDRRRFIATTAASIAGISVGAQAFSAPMIRNYKGANDKIRVGFIGIGNRGTQLLESFLTNKDVEVAALSDVYEPYLKRRLDMVDPIIVKSGKVPPMKELPGKNVKRYSDFRQLLDQKDIDAVCIATPDHWHAVQTLMALDAGKDIYVEKPLTIVLKEGRAMVEAQKRTDRVVQVGLNRRGSSIYQELAGTVEDMIGKVSYARAFRVSNMFPNGIGKLAPASPPIGMDWDMWIGPRAYQPFQYNIAPYYFRWWENYSSQMGNWGVHYMDAMRWMLGERAPSVITAHGGKYVLDDDRTIPDTMEVIFEFKSGLLIKFGIHEASSATGVQGGEIELSGAKGNLVLSQDRYTVNPAKPGQFQDWKKLIDGEEKKIESEVQYGDLNISEDSTARLIRNFLDCVKSRKEPWCPLEEGHRSTSFAHLANIALKTGGRVEWDADREVITNNKAANDLLDYTYRSPWKLS